MVEIENIQSKASTQKAKFKAKCLNPYGMEIDAKLALT